MHILTQSISFLTSEDHRPSTLSFLTCLRYIFNSSIIPEILSHSADESQILSKLISENRMSWYRLFLQCHTTQFSSTLVVPENTFTFCGEQFSMSTFVQEYILPLKKTMRYFSSTLQRCIAGDDTPGELLEALADVRSLTHLNVRDIDVDDLISLFLDSPSTAVPPQLEYLEIYDQYGNECDEEEGDDEEEEEENDEEEDDESCNDRPNPWLAVSSYTNKSTTESTTTTTTAPTAPTSSQGQTTTSKRMFNRLQELVLHCIHPGYVVKLLRRTPNLRSLTCLGEFTPLKQVTALCPKLTTVRLGGNDFDPDELTCITDNLPELTNFELEEGYEFGNIKNLEFLNRPWLASQLRTLKIRAQGTRFNNDDDWMYIGQLRSLIVLELSGFQEDLNDKRLIHAILANFAHLRELTITNAKITSTGLVGLTSSKNHSTMMTGACFLPHLVCLSLEGCTSIGGTAVSPKNLVNFFSWFCPEYGQKTPPLKRLSLRNTDLNNADLSLELTRLWMRCGVESLCLADNAKLDERGLSNLQVLTTSLTDLDISSLSNVSSLDFIGPLQQNLRTLTIIGLPKLKASAFHVFCDNPDSFLHLRKIDMRGSCTNQKKDTLRKTFDMLLKNINIKYRLEELCVQNVPNDYESDDYPTDKFRDEKVIFFF